MLPWLYYTDQSPVKRDNPQLVCKPPTFVMCWGIISTKTLIGDLHGKTGASISVHYADEGLCLLTLGNLAIIQILTLVTETSCLLWIFVLLAIRRMQNQVTKSVWPRSNFPLASSLVAVYLIKGCFCAVWRVVIRAKHGGDVGDLIFFPKRGYCY